MKTYIYPQNLKAKPHLWLWGMRDFVILATDSRAAMPSSGTHLFFFIVSGQIFGFTTVRPPMQPFAQM